MVSTVLLYVADSPMGTTLPYAVIIETTVPVYVYSPDGSSQWDGRSSLALA